MAFNTALSGLNATANELDVTSNNIANVSTTGFKKSRAEFSDVYANSQLGAGGTAIGSGVGLSAISQQFSQGQIEFTENNLDLAINGQGFFILSKNGSISYTRAGDFGIDKNGFITDSLGNVLQGFTADNAGNITGAQGDLQLNTANLPPNATQNASFNINLDATVTPPQNSFVRGFTPLNPPDPSTFNNSTSTTIYDSLGNKHLLSNYYVKGNQANVWQVYVGIDGVDVTPMPAATPAGTPPLPYGLGQIPDPFTIVFNSTGGYVQNSIAAPAEFYGPGPVTTLAPGLTNAGQIPVLNLNDLAINGTTIAATSLQSDPLSTTDNAGSGIAIAASINASTRLHGVTASVNPTSLNLGIPSFGNLAVGDLSINAVPIVGTNANPTELLGLINALTSSSGVAASQPGGAGTAIMLTAADGRNIQIQTGGANATGANFANFNLSGGSVLNKVQRATIDLSTNNNEGIVVTGVNPNNAGLSQGPLAGILQTNSDIIKINNWNPGSGAKSQDIAINLGNSTQYGSPFSVFQLSQDGYPTGQLSGINIDASGIIQAKFSNGQSLALGEVALANFGNTQGLSPIGNSDWVDTFASGSAIVGTPGTANFGLIQSGALEDSNVDLTSELVSLIIAQRNYQANAQTIRTEDAVMQAIINLR